MLELSPPAARQPAGGPQGVRTELVTRLRREIAGGTYLTADKLELAARRLHAELCKR